MVVKIAATNPAVARALRLALRGSSAEVYEVPVLKIQGLPIDVHEALEALERADVAVFASGRSAYAVRGAAEAAGQAERARRALAGKRVITLEGRKGAVMVKNAFGVDAEALEPGALSERVTACASAALFHYGERDAGIAGQLAARCGEVREFQPYQALPDPSAVERLSALFPDVAIFTSALAARHAASTPSSLEALRRARVVAAGEAIAAELCKYGIAVEVTGGRIPDIVRYVASLIYICGNAGTWRQEKR